MTTPVGDAFFTTEPPVGTVLLATYYDQPHEAIYYRSPPDDINSDEWLVAGNDMTYTWTEIVAILADAWLIQVARWKVAVDRLTRT